MPDEFSPELSEKFLCSLCCGVLDPPMQLSCCGTRICEPCNQTRLHQFPQCPFCDDLETPEARPDRGHQRELQRLIINCPRCKEPSMPFPELMKHLNSHHRDLQCGHCQEKFILPQQRQKHCTNYCINRTVPCPLACYGCSSKVIYHELNKHNLQVEHQQCLLRVLQQEFSQSYQKDTSLSEEKPSDEHYRHGLTQCVDKLSSLLQEMRAVMENGSRLESERQALETKITELRVQSLKIKESSDSNTKLLESLHQIFVNMLGLLDEIKSKSITGPKLISLDCCHVWNVNVHGLTNTGNEITSEPFFTSPSGYKIALTCSVYVDGPSQTNFLSISIMILPGEFDAILMWPVPFPITLSIENLSGKQAHNKQSFSKELEASVLNRPSNSLSASYRIVKFCPMEDLLKDANNYIQDNSLFIRTKFDFMAKSAQSLASKSQLTIPQDYIQNNILPIYKSS